MGEQYRSFVGSLARGTGAVGTVAKRGVGAAKESPENPVQTQPAASRHPGPAPNTRGIQISFPDKPGSLSLFLYSRFPHPPHPTFSF